MVAFIVLTLVLMNIAFFLLSLTDMRRRGESRPGWFFRFLLLGPLAITWYKTYRKPADHTSETVERNLYSLAENLIKPWSIYVLMAPLIVFGLVICGDVYSGHMNLAHIPEGLAWFAVLFAILVIPIWLVSLLVLKIIMRMSRPGTPDS